MRQTSCVIGGVEAEGEPRIVEEEMRAVALLIIVTLLAGACAPKPFVSPAATPMTAPALSPLSGEKMTRTVRSTSTPAGYPGPVAAAIRTLAEKLGVPVGEVTVTAWEPVDWPDASLGCPEPGMMYAQVITPGYQVMLEAQGKIHRVHTDRSGQRIILCDR